MKEQWVWHSHHDVLCEPLSEPIENRADYIRTNKPAEEIEIRLRLLHLVRGLIPISVLRAREEVQRLSAVYLGMFKEYPNGARLDRDMAWRTYDKAQRDYEDAKASPEMVALHKAECPNCPWDGFTIFPSDPPSCCVEFYVSQWRRWPYDEREAYYREAETAFFAKFKDIRLSCLPCPRCLSKSHFMQNRGAPCKCLKEHRLERRLRNEKPNQSSC